MPEFTGQSEAIQETLQGACCYQLCEPVTEPEDNQFLAAVLWGLVQASGTPVDEMSNDDVQAASRQVSCELNLETLCSIPPDRIKALILAYVAAL